MSGLLNVASRALMANQTVLQTTGNNIANVNTAGYSRQSVVLETIQGQFSGSGYIGKGVEVTTIQRNYSTFLTRQSTLAGSISAGDTARAEKLRQLESLFPGGTNALGAAVNDMLNAFSDVASAPTDLTARRVALTRVNETALRMRNASASLDELQTGVKLEVGQKITSINTLATSLAKVNEKIARVHGNGQPPNDLLDQREQLTRELNKLVQTTAIAADDGTIGLFIGGSQALVLGNEAASLKLVDDEFGDPWKSKVALVRNGIATPMDDTALGGGEVPGLIRFQNTDLADTRNLLGRYAMAITTSMNDQHKLGLDLDGNVGGNLFTPIVLGAANMLKLSVQPPSATLGLAITDVTRLSASDYEVSFASATTGVIQRASDGVQVAFDLATPPVTFDGLTLSVAAGAAVAGDRFLLKPFSSSASNLSAEFSTPRALAVASPWAGKMGTANLGSLQQASLTTRNQPVGPPTPLTIKFISATQYIRSDDPSYANYPLGFPLPLPYEYASGTPIEASLPNNYPTVPYTYTLPLADWSVTLQGVPKPNDTYTMVDIKDATLDPLTNRPNNNGIDYKLNSGNASAMMSLRDVAMFDGAAMTDGYADLIANLGVRTQSANYTAEVSSALAATLETDRTAVAGVNLDEEAAKLLQFQQAYQASAKVIQIAQGIFDTLIQTISR